MSALSLVFDIIARDRASRELDRVGDSADRAGQAGHRFGGALGAIGVAGVGLAAVGLASVFSGFIQGAESGARLGRISAQIIKQTGSAAGVTADQVSALADSIERKTGADGDAIQSGANVLLTFTNIRNEVGKGNDIFTQTVGIAQDMATVLGGDASTAAVQLGKALNDPVKGITALSKAGVSFTAQQKEQIAVLVQSGDVLGAQKIILAELGKEFGGAAEAAASPLERLRARLGQVAEAIGTRLLPIIDKAVAFFDRNSASVDALGNATASAAGLLMQFAQAGASVVGFLNNNRTAVVLVAAAVTGLYLPAITAAITETLFLTYLKLGSFFLNAAAGAGIFAAGLGGVTLATAAATAGLSLIAAALAITFFKARAEAAKTKQAISDLVNVKFTANAEAEYKKNREALVAIADAAEQSAHRVRSSIGARNAAVIAQTDKQFKTGRDNVDALSSRYDALTSVVDRLGQAFGLSAAEILKLGDAARVDIGAAGFDKAAAAISAYQSSAVAAKTGAQVLGEATAVLASKTATAEERTKALDAAINALFGTQLSAEAAADAFAGKINDLSATLKSNSDQVEGNSAAALANRSALRDVTQSFLDNIDAARKNGASQDELSRKFDEGVASFRKSAAAAGLTAAQIDNLARQYGLIPENKNTVVGVSGVDAAIAQVERVRTTLDNLKSKVVSLTTVLRSEDTRGPRPGFNVDPVPTPAGARAMGGPIAAFKPYLVGERGPELVIPAHSGTVITADKTRDILGGGGSFTGTLVLDSGEFLGQVHGVMDSRDRASLLDTRAR